LGLLVFQRIGRYIGRHFLFWFGICLAAILSIIYLFEFIDLLRRAMSKPEIPLSMIAKMSFFRTFGHIGVLLPFVTFFGSIICLNRLKQMKELLIIRSFGVSAWQMFFCLGFVVVLLHSVYLFVLNPISAAFVGGYQRMESVHFAKNSSPLAIIGGKIWFCENSNDTKSIACASEINFKEGKALNVTFYDFDNAGHFKTRYDAKVAEIENGQWLLYDVFLLKPEFIAPEKIDTAIRPTKLSILKITENFASPESMPFWSLDDFSKHLRKNGLSSHRYDIYWYQQLAMVVLMLSLMLLALAFCLYPQKTRNSSPLIFCSILFGLLIYFLNNVVYALGAAEKIPAILSVLFTPLLTSMLSCVVLLRIENNQ